MHIVIVDGYTTNPGDLSWHELEKLGRLTVYDRCNSPEELVHRCKNAAVIITNKAPITSQMMEQLPLLELICVSATGYNIIDIQAAKEKNIEVRNVAGYSTQAVAQLVFAYILHFSSGVSIHNESVRNGQWQQQPDFSYTLFPLREIQGKTVGVIGTGKIGQAVIQIALGFGMKVIAPMRHSEKDVLPNVTYVPVEKLWRNSDFITLHVPLNGETKHLVNKTTLEWMKSTAILINTGRGDLIHEGDLLNALENEIIAGAALDVLSEEPPSKGNPLIGAKNCLVTPHIAWAAFEARERLIEEVALNIRAWMVGENRNVVG